MLNDETFEFSQARLRLNASLRFTPRVVGENTTYFAEDEVTGRFFRLGVPQYTFLSMLDGNRSVSTALMKTATLLREHAIDESEAASLCKWAIESGLIESETGNSAERRNEQHDRQVSQRILSWVNPLMLRVPLFNPQHIVETLYRYLGFTVSIPGLLIWLGVVVYGFLQLAPHWQKFFEEQVSSFGINDAVWLALTWIILKVAHEAAHAIVCRRFGGRTHECGVLLLMLIPMPFVDLTSSWRFNNKWKRILTSAAGMMLELFIAAIACVIWVDADPGPLQYHMGNLILSATMMTLLFNINPLMRFDGYYMLADFLEIPNLSPHGRQWLKSVFRRLFFGVPHQPPRETGYRGLSVRLYGLLASIWSLLVVVGLSFAAYSFVDGIGLLIAVLGATLWFGIPMVRLVGYLFSEDLQLSNRFWFVCATSAAVLLVAGFMKFCPSPSLVSAPIVFDYEPFSTVRPKAPGFVGQVHVKEGEEVSSDQLLITLHNPELEHQLHSLRIDIAISELKIKNLFTRQEITQMQLEEESLVAMRDREAELTVHLANLEVRSPQNGTILGRDLESLQGQWFEPGQELMSVGDRDEIVATALATQSDVQWLEGQSAPEADLLIWGRHKEEFITGVISRVRPRARDDVPHEAFAATAGGPLAVVSRQQSEDKKASSSSSAQDLMLTEPRVPIEITLPAADREFLSAGQTGLMLVRSRDENMWSFLTRKVKRMAREETHRTHGL